MAEPDKRREALIKLAGMPDVFGALVEILDEYKDHVAKVLDRTGGNALHEISGMFEARGERKCAEYILGELRHAKKLLEERIGH